MIYDRKTFSGCNDLPLYNFIKIVVFNETKWLYSEKKTSINRNLKETHLQAIWETIYSEYTNISNNPQSGQIMALISEITNLNISIEFIGVLCDHLELYRSEELIAILRTYGFMYPFSENSMESDIKLTRSSAKRMMIKKMDAEKEYIKLNKTEKEVTEVEFNGIIAQLSKFMSFRIDPKIATVMDFVNYMECLRLETK